MLAAPPVRLGWIPEGRLRRAVGWVLLYLQFQGGLGLVWDERWHAVVGRDTFFTPPHVLLYSSVALTGILCLVFVLWDTVRYRDGAGADDRNSIRLLRVFHAPVGAALAGFGALTTALAAPFDNYWHLLYGIDVALWTPFHLMGAIGAVAASLGVLYFWAAILVDARRSGKEATFGTAVTLMPRRSEEWAVLLAIVATLDLLLNLAEPGRFRYPLVGLGGLRLATFPVLLALAVPAMLVLARRMVGPAGPTCIAALAFLRHLVIGLYVPWAIQMAASAEGLLFRRRLGSVLTVRSALFDLGLVALTLPWLLRGRKPRVDAAAPDLRSAAAAGAFLAAGLWVLATLGRPSLSAPDLHALPLAVMVGAAGASGGAGLAEVLRRNRR